MTLFTLRDAIVPLHSTIDPRRRVRSPVAVERRFRSVLSLAFPLARNEASCKNIGALPILEFSLLYLWQTASNEQHGASRRRRNSLSGRIGSSLGWCYVDDSADWPDGRSDPCTLDRFVDNMFAHATEMAAGRFSEVGDMVDGVRYWRFLIAAALCAGSPVDRADAAECLGTGIRGSHLSTSDMAVFEAGETRKDLPCDVVPSKPELGFDLRFHTGYDIVVPMRDLAGTENLLTVLFRVTEQRDGTAPIYSARRSRFPLIDEDAKGDAYMYGSLRRRRGQVSRRLADAGPHRAGLFLGMGFRGGTARQGQTDRTRHGAGVIQPSNREQFKDEPPIARVAERPLSVKMLINFAPQKVRLGDHAADRHGGADFDPARDRPGPESRQVQPGGLQPPGAAGPVSPG